MKEKLFTSRWFVTINSNQANTPENKTKIDNFTKIIKRLVLSRMFLNFLQVNDEKDADKDKESLITEGDVVGVFEVGKQRQLYHTHIDITLYHRSNFSLVGHLVHAWILQKSGLSCAVQVKFIPNAPDLYIKRYQLKDTELDTFSWHCTLKLLNGKVLHYDYDD